MSDHDHIDAEEVHQPDDLADVHAAYEDFLTTAASELEIMSQKADTIDGVALLTAFLVAFAIDNVLDLDSSSFENDTLFQLFAIFVSLTVGSGLIVVLITTFTSLKLKRLIGRDHFRKHSNVSVDRKERQIKVWKERGCTTAVYAFYNNIEYRGKKVNVRKIVSYCYLMFVFVLANYIMAIAVKIIDTLDVSGIIITSIIVFLNGVTIIYLYVTGIMRDLA